MITDQRTEPEPVDLERRREEVKKAIYRLPIELRVVVLLRLYMKSEMEKPATFREIATQLNKPLMTVHERYKQAKSQLAIWLSDLRDTD